MVTQAAQRLASGAGRVIPTRPNYQGVAPSAAITPAALRHSLTRKTVMRVVYRQLT